MLSPPIERSLARLCPFPYERFHTSLVSKLTAKNGVCSVSSTRRVAPPARDRDRHAASTTSSTSTMPTSAYSLSMLGASGGVCRLSPIDAQDRRHDVQHQHRLARRSARGRAASSAGARGRRRPSAARRASGVGRSPTPRPGSARPAPARPCRAWRRPGCRCRPARSPAAANRQLPMKIVAGGLLRPRKPRHTPASASGNSATEYCVNRIRAREQHQRAAERHARRPDPSMLSTQLMRVHHARRTTGC